MKCSKVLREIELDPNKSRIEPPALGVGERLRCSAERVAEAVPVQASEFLEEPVLREAADSHLRHAD